MARGRRPTWDYERIAKEYNLFFGREQGEVSAEQVRKDLRRKRDLFDRLTATELGHAAYYYLRLILDEKMNEEQVLSTHRTVPSIPLLRKFTLDPDYVPSLPGWYRKTVRKWLDVLDNSETRMRTKFSPAGADTAERASLSLYLMAACLLDERFTWLVNRVRRIWRINHPTYPDSEAWYEWLFNEQERALKRFGVLRASTEELLKERTVLGGGSGMVEPPDRRNVRGDLEHSPYSYPLIDYRFHLRQLAFLAGGDPFDDLWECWAEAILWELKPRYGAVRNTIAGTRQVRVRDEFLGPVAIVNDRHVSGPPPTEARVVYDSEVLTGQPPVRLEIPSRWVSATSFPPEFRHELVLAVSSIWGAYRQVILHAQRISYLRRLVSRSNRKPDPQKLLETLWEEREDELKSLDVVVQNQIERDTVRRASDRYYSQMRRFRRRL